jgi:hypothetical protein
LMTWWFRSPANDESVRDPVHDEFFADDSIRDVCEALVREGIQNALDAGQQGDDPVVVRVGVRRGIAGDSEGNARRREFLSGLQPHWEARGVGIQRPPRDADELSWIIFEDFGTTGLVGNPKQAFPEDEPNPFFAFFRAEGYSEKRTTQRGRWGLGKFAFPRASLGRCFFGLTVREDDGKRFLMGRCTLKSHRIGETRYTPDGFYGLREEGMPVMPYSDPAIIDVFARAYGLARDDSRSGLSIVVPFVDPNEVKSASLLAAVLRGYWLAILSGQLNVHLVEEDGNVLELTAGTIAGVLQRLSSQDRDMLVPLVELGRWGLQQRVEDLIVIASQPDARAPRWNTDAISDELLERIQEQADSGRVKVRVELSVKPKTGTHPTRTHFDILLERTDDGRSHRPMFLREGILISDVRSPVPNGWRCIVLVDDAPLATMLGDSENPAHTRWLKEGTHFKGKYFYGPETISFVTGSVRSLIDRLSSSDQQADPSVLADVLSVLLPEDSGRRRKPKKSAEDPTETTPPEVDVEAPSRRFNLSKVAGGFCLSGTGAAIPVGTELAVRVAYDVRNGNAFSAWHEFDFDLSKPPIRIQEQAEAEVLEKRENRVRLQLLSERFRFVLSGFDPMRDLKVDARIVEGVQE